jgi:hypothetical protein
LRRTLSLERQGTERITRHNDERATQPGDNIRYRVDAVIRGGGEGTTNGRLQPAAPVRNSMRPSPTSRPQALEGRRRDVRNARRKAPNRLLALRVSTFSVTKSATAGRWRKHAHLSVVRGCWQVWKSACYDQLYCVPAKSFGVHCKAPVETVNDLHEPFRRKLSLLFGKSLPHFPMVNIGHHVLRRPCCMLSMLGPCTSGRQAPAVGRRLVTPP